MPGDGGLSLRLRPLRAQSHERAHRSISSCAEFRRDTAPGIPGLGDVQQRIGYRVSNRGSGVGELKGRQVPLTMRAMKEGELKMLLSLAFGNEVIGVIKSGRDMDRPYGFVIERTAYRYRVNISGA